MGVQDASRPRTGPSPPGLFGARTVHTNLLPARRKRTPGCSRGGSSCPAFKHFPVRPDLDQLKHQAKELLRAIHGGAPEALAELETFHPEKIDPASAKLAAAQLVLARSYGAPSWPRMVLSCRLIDAIWRDDIDEVREIVQKNPPPAA
jgi:hypothetical protein